VSLKKLGRYELIRVLGKGAMGVVYEGRDPNLDRRVAIKTVKVENLSEEAAAEYEHRFRTEARSAARLQHPNIVSVYDSDRDGDIAFLVMEYIQGDDLKHHLDRGVRYSLEQSLKMIRDLLSALDYAHKQGIVHRDIKPANLLIEPGGRVKLTDFGVARIQDSSEATRTQGSMVGTLKYMSPEQVQGQKIDFRADLFSVGVVLYQLLTDKRPFDGDNDFSIIHQIIGHNPPAPSSFNARLPTAIDAVVARALAKDREQRFTTARDFAVALQSAIRRAEDQTVVPPADPSNKADVATGSRAAAPTAPGTAPGGATSGTATNTVTQELELVYWKDIKDSTDPEELQGFLEKFPAGIYADLARRRLRKLASGSSGDQTMLSGTVPGGGDPDMEATRLRTDASRPLVVPRAESSIPTTVTATLPVARVQAQEPKAPAAEGAAVPPHDDATRTLIEPRQAEQAATATAAAVAATATAGSTPAATPPSVPAPPASAPPASAPAAQSPAPRKKSPLPLLAGLAALAVAGIAAVAMMGGGAPTAESGPLPAASAPADGPPAGPVAAGASAPVDAASAATVATRAASAPAPAVAASTPRRVAKPVKPASAPVVEATRPSPPPLVVQETPKPAPAASAGPSAAGLVDQCKDKIFIAKELCLAEHCEKPGARNHPLCVQRRADIRLREESKIRQGPQ
jgi:serine/threonine protein kinase